MKYGEYGPVTYTRGKVHDYLGMDLDFRQKGKVIVDMTKYMKDMIQDYRIELGPKDKAATPAALNAFEEDEDSPLLGKEEAEHFHTMVAKGLFACKRGRPDIHTAIANLSTRVKAPTEDDDKKLLRLMKYINATQDDKLSLTCDNLRIIKWYVDSSFAVHPDMKSHTGGVMSYGRGAAISASRKQKINTRSSTEAELVGADDMATMVLWTRLFMEAQGYEIDKNIIFQDNKSTMLLEKNGKKSSKRTRALDIRYFFITDQITRNTMDVEYCPGTEMIGDYMTKPLQGKLFAKFKRAIMGE
jgi:hypothetical protein